MNEQMLTRPPALKAVALLLSGIGLLPGMPLVPFLALAGSLFAIANRSRIGP